MTKEQKTKIIDNLSEEFKSSDAIIVASYKGTSHKKLEALRIEALKNNTKVKVVKNKNREDSN